MRNTRVLLGLSLLLFLSPALAPAQEEQLTPEQRQMLNSLPPDQREEALRAMRQMSAQQDAAEDASIREEIEPRDETDDELADDELDMFEDGRAREFSELIITLTPKPFLEPDVIEEMEEDALLSDLSGSASYTLDREGQLFLPGLEPIAVLGLSAEEVGQRLAAVDLLDNFDILVNILPTELTGQQALEPFGYELFRRTDASFLPSQSGPVPPDYVLGPGDSVRVQLFGNVSGIYEFEVSREGILNLPQIGPVTVAGIPFSEFRQDLNERVAEMLIGTQVSVTMGPLRTMRVFVLGDVERPGSHILSGLSTITHALYESGGITEVGSLRKVELKRRGELVETLDLYALLLEGDNSRDARLQPGDVVFVPPVGPTVGILGSVRRPAVYEMKGRTSVEAAVALAGGLRPEADRSAARIERVAGDRQRHVISLDLGDAEDLQAAVESGDSLFVPEILADLGNTVVLRGHVQRPGPAQWFPGMRLTDLIRSPLQLKPGVDDGYVLVRRENVRGEPVEMLSADLGVALANPSSNENIALESRDTVFVFSLSYGRQQIIAPLMQELELQATYDRPLHRVAIAGNVRAPGAYPLESGMRVSDLLRAGGSLAEEAFTLRAELTRFVTEGGDLRKADVIDVDLDAVLSGDTVADLMLAPHDHISITRIPEWDTDGSIVLEGEVRFPGEYKLRKGETLRSVVDRAGGLTDVAFPAGAIFLREDLKQREAEQVETLVRRLEADLASLSLASVETTGTETLATGQALLEQLRGYEPVGRLVINTGNFVGATGPDAVEIELRDGDRFLVPQRSQVVTVIGEAQQNTSHLYDPVLNRDDYIEMSGGLTRRADRKLIYVVRANGGVIAGSRSRWLGGGRQNSIEPGDTIVIPLDTDRIRPLTFWTNVTQILYQGAIAVAAVNSF
ncbi:MAG: SLBB domain-containing protein [Woeseiaceae bacterium]|nr:SLBB domain-containing protein [Woeseiaceae bacterium]